MSSLIDTIALMKESVHALSGQPPQKIYLGEHMKTAMIKELFADGHLRTDLSCADDELMGMEVVEVSNDPWALAIAGHVVQQALPL